MNNTVQQIPLSQLQSSPENRLVGGFNEEKLRQLAESIRTAGVLQPIVARPRGKGAGYEIVAGERRWRAAELAGLTEVPCLVRDLDDITCMRIRLIENLQREDIHPLDEAEGYGRLIERAGYDVEKLAAEVHKSISYVYQRLKLRELIPAARKLLIDGRIQAGHAVLIARLPPAQQAEVLQGYALQRGEEISVRDISSFIQHQILLDLSKAAFRRDDADLDPEAKVALVVAGDSPGRLTYGKERKQNRYGRAEPTAAEKKKAEKERLEDKIKHTTRRRLWDTVFEKLTAKGFFEDPLPADALRQIALQLWEHTWDNHRALFCRTAGWEKPEKKAGEYSNGWKDLGNGKIRAMSAAELRQFLLACSIIGEMDFSLYNDPEPEQLLALAKSVRVDAKAIEEKTRLELAEKGAKKASA